MWIGCFLLFLLEYEVLECSCPLCLVFSGSETPTALPFGILLNCQVMWGLWRLHQLWALGTHSHKSYCFIFLCCPSVSNKFAVLNGNKSAIHWTHARELLLMHGTGEVFKALPWDWSQCTRIACCKLSLKSLTDDLCVAQCRLPGYLDSTCSRRP